jgi:saccharopine dehydrogenase-like NADP-dependent oxidoreductase
MAVRDVVEMTDASVFDTITIGEYNEKAARALIAELNDSRVDFVKIDVNDREDTIKKLKGYDVVMDGTTIKLNDRTTDCIANAGCSGVNLNGFGDEYKYDKIFKENGKIMVPGFGMTPGLTDMMLKHGADQCDTVDTVRVSHGAFRPIAYSPAIFETTAYEYDPNLPGRVVFEDGEFKQVPPFARARNIKLPEPYGENPQWIIPHSETITGEKYLREKGVRLIEVRGTWPPKNMRLVKALYEWGITRNDTFTYKGVEMGIMSAIGAYLQQSKEGTETELNGYSLHIQVVGTRNGKKVEHVLTHTHPTSDGSVKGWVGLDAYVRNVGTPMAVAAILMAKNLIVGKGAVIPEDAFDPKDVFEELEKRKIFIHEEINEL